jgi:hypothetical protein
VSVTHAAEDELIHAQVDAVVTVIVPLPPPAGTETRTGATENEHDGLGSLTTKLCPAMVRVTLRAALVVLAAAVNPTVPKPVRFVPLEMVTHDAGLEALHVHPAAVATITVPVPPEAFNARLSAEIEYEHAAAACVMINVRPPAVTLPVRAAPAFAATT